MYSATYYGGSFYLENYPTLADIQRSRTQILSSVSGSNTIVGQLTPALAQYELGLLVRFKATALNTGAVTLNVNSLGAKAVQWKGQALTGGEIQANAWVEAIYDGTVFQILNHAGEATSAMQPMAFGQISNGTTTVNVGTAITTSLTTGAIGVTSSATVKHDYNQFSADASGNVVRYYKSRGAASPTNTVVQSGDELGRFDFISANGTGYTTSARFIAHAKGLVGSNYPGYYVWYTVGTATGMTERMRLSEDGELSIGTATPFGDALITAQKSSGINRIAAISSSIADTESVAVLARGTVSGVTRDSSLLVYKHSGITNACAAFELQRQSGTRDLMWNDDSGNFRTSTVASNVGTTGGTVVGTQTSDERLKNVVGPIENALDKVAQLSPVKFTYKDAPTKHCLGFLAQQVRPIVPESVYDTREPIDGYDPEDTEGSEGAEHGAQGTYDGKAKRQPATSHVKGNGDANFGQQKTGYRTNSGKKDKNYF
jgi:hypothetical protein